MKVAVIGAGIIGLATTAALLESGQEVVCFERRAPMAERSAGESRIFRLAHRDPELVDLARQSRELFARWEEQAHEVFIDPVGVVVSGVGLNLWSDAMSAAAAAYVEVGPDSDQLRLPTSQIPAESLIDPAGGVIRVARIGAFLTSRCQQAVRIEHVYGLEDGADAVVVHTSGSHEAFDAVLLCAGAGTAPLAVQAGLYPPISLAHHVRFTFRTRPQAPPRMQSWINTPPDGVASYQHSNAPGQWSVGVYADPADVVWDAGAPRASATMRELTTSYVQKSLSAIDPAVIDELYCTVNPDLGDGVQFLRSGRILAVHGENLFKLASLIGHRLAVALMGETLPARMGRSQRPRHLPASPR
jgi:sarcosine oxidase